MSSLRKIAWYSSGLVGMVKGKAYYVQDFPIKRDTAGPEDVSTPVRVAMR